MMSGGGVLATQSAPKETGIRGVIADCGCVSASHLVV